MGWSATLRTGIEDAAAYRSGLDLRVPELGTGLSIAQLGRAGRPLRDPRGGRDRGPRVSRRDGDAAGRAPGDRRDRPGQPGDPARLAAGLLDDVHVPSWPPVWRFPTPAVAGGSAGIGCPPPTRASSAVPLPAATHCKLDAIVATDGGDTVSVALGIVSDGMTTGRGRCQPTPAAAVDGAHLPPRPDDPGPRARTRGVRRATVAFDGLDGLIDDRPDRASRSSR